MKRNFKLRLVPSLIVALTLAFTLAVLGVSRPTFAEEAAINGVEISPATRKYELDPSASKIDTMTVTNVGDKTIDFEIKIKPFQVAQDPLKETAVSGDYLTSNAYTQIVNWITLNTDSGSLEPGKSVDIEYTINVPDNAPGGGQYAAIIVSGYEQSKDVGTVNAVPSPGLVISAKISGETKVSGAINNVSIPQFLFNPPITATVDVENTGNVDQDIKIGMKVENYLTGAEIYSNLSSDQFVKTIMPEMSRKLEVTAKASPRLGLYKVTLTTDYLNETKVNTSVVIICPIWLIVVLLLMVAVIVFSLVMKLTSRKRTRDNSRNTTGSSGNMNL